MKRIVSLCLLLLLWVVSVHAQEVAPAPGAETDPNASITWPPPVYVLRGTVEFRGSANLDGMTNYFIEYRTLADALAPAAPDIPWLPAMLPTTSAVVNETLGTWDTTTAEDGLYEVRLVVNRTSGDPVVFRLSPLRVENAGQPPAAATEAPAATNVPLPTIAAATEAPAQPTPTLQPTPTAFDPTPRVTPNTAASVNIRSGDGTNYTAIGFLNPGETARIIGVSSSGSGWYNVELPNGQRGWVAGGVVEVLGNAFNLPRIDPPATPTPPATATPTLPDVSIIGLRYDRGEIKQGEEFQIIVRARNTSGVFMPDTQVLCTVKPQGREVSANVGSLNAFEERDIAMRITLNSGGGSNVTVDCAIDVNQLVQELDENNNFFSITTPLRAP